MKNNKKIVLTIIVLIILLFIIGASYFTQKKSTQQQKTEVGAIFQGALVFKTNKDYSKYVWVGLYPDKSKVSSYPGKGDIFLYPQIKLHNGYYTDDINIPGVPINITLDAYSKMAEEPDPSIMYNLILDKDPISELYQCPFLYPNAEGAVTINSYIDNNQLEEKCKKLDPNPAPIVLNENVPDSFTRRACSGNSLPMPTLYKKNGKYYWEGILPYTNANLPSGNRIEEILKEEYIRDYNEDQLPCPTGKGY
ncbi:MAG: hypothetical protein WCI93_01725 [bacterium]